MFESWPGTRFIYRDMPLRYAFPGDGTVQNSRSERPEM